ncbi:chemotaxis protein CheB [[Phormidium ambiguum] IAM M-71]|uniref:protein-glutamate methylesterase n=1 Tax=[Phormidium ambiguum] IAM M-71 TaxID=454136 RepID=A0A1U7IP80_9CYAN|nr:chemotaxis protein CheB [Phormidium ambiguum]OKH39147.1 chemotaxis protein CheB [Phormidium ambiguum IAM M-71]
MSYSNGNNQVNHCQGLFFDIVGITASSDGTDAIINILKELPKDFPVPILIVKHLAIGYKSYFPLIFAHRTLLTVKEAENGEKVKSSVVYVAPPDYHLVVNTDREISLIQTGKVNYVRPSADVLLKSIAENYQARSIAVILTGADSDGAEGVRAIKQMGGTVIAQDEATSGVFGMPGSAIATGCVDFILPIDQIAEAIVNLVHKGAIE